MNVFPGTFLLLLALGLPSLLAASEPESLPNTLTPEEKAAGWKLFLIAAKVAQDVYPAGAGSASEASPGRRRDCAGSRPARYVCIGLGARPEVVRYQVESMDAKVAQAVPRLPGMCASGSGHAEDVVRYQVESVKGSAGRPGLPQAGSTARYPDLGRNR